MFASSDIMFTIFKLIEKNCSEGKVLVVLMISMI